MSSFLLATFAPNFTGRAAAEIPPGARSFSFEYIDITRIRVAVDFDSNDSQGRKTTYNIKGDFVDGNVWDSNREYALDAKDCEKNSTIRIKNNEFGGRDAVFVAMQKSPFGQTCISRTFDIAIANVPARSKVAFKYINADTISSLQNNTKYGRTNDPNKWIATHSSCTNTMILSTQNIGKVTMSCTDKDEDYDEEFNNLYRNVTFFIDNSPQEPAQDTGGGGTTSDDLTCEKNGTKLNWILCPVFDIISGLADFLFKFLINPFLITEPIDTNSNSAIYKIWSDFRIYGNIFLVIALLVVVFGQSIGGGLIDSYTAKKVLPRLLASAILINLSIYIVAFMVDITNIVGGGLGALITAPLNGAGAFQISPSGVEAGIIAGATGVGLLAGSSAIIAAISTTAGATFIAISVLLPAALGLLAAVVTLVLRQGIILALVLISPVAFALYCLPNTEKYFKQWWSTLVKALMVYPIIIMIFAVANVLAFTVTAGNNGVAAGSFAQVIAFLLQFIPLLMIPFAFRLAGGAIGKIGDIAAGTAAKGNNMMKSRREQAGFRFKQAKATRAAQVNRGINRSPIGSVMGATPGLRRLQSNRIQRLDQNNAALKADYAKTAGAQAIQHDDNAVRAQTYSNYNKAVDGLTKFQEKYHLDNAADKLMAQNPNLSRDQAEAQARVGFAAEARRAASAAAAAGGFGTSQAMFAAEAMGKTGTTFEDQRDQAEVIARASGGSAGNMASLAGNLNSVNKQVGRHDLAPSFGTLLEQSQAEASGASDDTKAKLYAAGQTKAWNSGSLYQHANDKPQNIKAAVRHYEEMARSGDQEKIEDALVFFNELDTMLPNSSGEVRNVIAEAQERNANIISSRGGLQGVPDDVVKRIKDRSRSYQQPDPNKITP